MLAHRLARRRARHFCPWAAPRSVCRRRRRSVHSIHRALLAYCRPAPGDEPQLARRRKRLSGMLPSDRRARRGYRHRHRLGLLAARLRVFHRLLQGAVSLALCQAHRRRHLPEPALCRQPLAAPLGCLHRRHKRRQPRSPEDLQARPCHPRRAVRATQCPRPHAVQVLLCPQRPVAAAWQCLRRRVGLCLPHRVQSCPSLLVAWCLPLPRSSALCRRAFLAAPRLKLRVQVRRARLCR
mmetsp:Transcript_50707/g.147617  ORF Transcript_50707/g.147617 Transcript_50707/m.147617 type:complete len:238 (-) Transcript_50707:609-1322(-)